MPWHKTVAGLTALGLLAAVLAVVSAPCSAAVYTDPDDPNLPADAKVQGEYVGQIEGGAKLAAQVIALDQGALQAVLYPGGLPGNGWDGKQKILLDGRLEGNQATLKPAEGPKQYLAQSPSQFSATSSFPPEGQKPYTATIQDGTLAGKTDDGKPFTLKRTERTSPTMGMEPPADAIVLFDGTSLDEWQGGRIDEKAKLLNTDGRDVLTKRKFNDYTMHIEFLLPFKPEGRGQGRGNSGMYQVDHYEVQILDSFGLDGKDNECGGIYTLKPPDVNMCFPPLAWQTYDVEFTNAVTDASGKKIKNAVITVKHNGVVIHDALELPNKTGGSRGGPEGTPGPIKLQGHGNPLQFRNIWVVEKSGQQ